MKKMCFKELFMPAVVLFAICLLSTLLLALTNQLTAPIIAAQADKNASSAVYRQVLPAAQSFSKSLEVNLNGTAYIYYKGLNSAGKTMGYVFTTVTQGYGGDVKILSGIDTKGAVTGIKILQLTETPNVGMKAYDLSFLKQFLGETGTISVVKTTAGKNQIKAMTGATITSRAVTGAVNIALSLYDAVNGKTVPTTQGSLSAADTARKLLLPAASSVNGPVKISLNGIVYSYYKGISQDSSTAGYVFSTQARTRRGYTVIIETGIGINGSITGVKPVALNVTYGYGMEAINQSSLNKYIGKSVKITGNDNIKAITGASETSDTVTAAVNIALNLFKSVAGK